LFGVICILVSSSSSSSSSSTFPLPFPSSDGQDEATAAAEAMNMAYQYAKRKRNTFFADANTHPQTLAVLKTRANLLAIELVVGDYATFDLAKRGSDLFGVLVQYPGTDGMDVLLLLLLLMIIIVPLVHASHV
jgi:glycine cleavage system pyridoxal-binding protein P